MQTPLQLDIWLYSYEGFENAKNKYETKEFEYRLCQYLKNNIPNIRLIPLDHVTYVQMLRSVVVYLHNMINYTQILY